MGFYMTQLDLSSELQIVPHYNGVRLARPKNDGLHPTVGAVIDFPCNVYFLNTVSAVLNINTHSAASCGYQSTNDAIGTTVFDCLDEENANVITSVDKRVINENCSQIHEDVMIRRDGAMMNFLTVKAPIYNNENKISGIMGCSVMLGHQPLADSIALISKTGILNNRFNKTSSISNNVNWTPRENDIIQLLARGKTAKEIGAMLYLSRRTIEHYIENIKLKMCVKTKSELINEIISLNLI